MEKFMIIKIEFDQWRESQLIVDGYGIIRFKNYEMLADIENVFIKIRDSIINH
jgi:very-short-patch-repair endonuclease